MSKKYKVYNETYVLEKESEEAPSMYALNNELYDEPPGGKFVGYITLEDDSVVQCFRKINPLKILMPVIIVFLIVAGIGAYFMFFQPKDVSIGGMPIKEGNDEDVVSYNGFMSYSEDLVDIYFTNGDVVAQICIKGDGVKCDPITVQPNETVDVIPVTCDTDKSLVNAVLVIKTPTSTYEQPVVIEVPENETLNSPESGLDNYWRGETIYGQTPAGEPTVNDIDDVSESESP